MHDFGAKLKESLDENVRKVLDTEYRRLFPGLKRVEVIKSDDLQKSGNDVCLHIKRPGGTLFTMTYYEFIQEKIRSPKYSHYSDVALEYLSAEEFQTAGWCITCEADYLNYVWNNIPVFLRMLIVPMQPLKRWFILRYTQREDWDTIRAENDGYSTISKIVPSSDKEFKCFLSAIGYYYRQIEADELSEILGGKK